MSLGPISEESRQAAESHRQFMSACARAFAGTRWKPYRYEAHNEAAGSLHTIVLKLTLRDLLETLPDPEIFPRPCRVRDPRFHLRAKR